MYMVRFKWNGFIQTEKEYELQKMFRGVKHMGQRPNVASIYRQKDTDPVEPTELEFASRFRQLEYALHPVEREVRYECEEAREQFEWRVK